MIRLSTTQSSNTYTILELDKQFPFIIRQQSFLELHVKMDRHIIDLHTTMGVVLGNESKKQRDQCGSSTQYIRVAYNGERGVALPLMPLFICVS